MPAVPAQLAGCSLSPLLGDVRGVRPHGWSSPAQLLLPHPTRAQGGRGDGSTFVFASGDHKATLEGKAWG